MFDGLENRLAQALFAIPAVKGVEFGSGFAGAALRGSENNDPYCMKNGAVCTRTNHAGGILGGLSTGMPIVFRAAFKPTPSIALPQQTVRLSDGAPVTLELRGGTTPASSRGCSLRGGCGCGRGAGRRTGGTDMEALNDLRQDIDALDAQLAALYRRRMDVAARIAAVKREQGLPVLQPEREQEIVPGLRSWPPGPAARYGGLFGALRAASRTGRKQPRPRREPALRPAGRTPAPQLFPGNSRHARRVFL